MCPQIYDTLPSGLNLPSPVCSLAASQKHRRGAVVHNHTLTKHIPHKETYLFILARFRGIIFCAPTVIDVPLHVVILTDYAFVEVFFFFMFSLICIHFKLSSQCRKSGILFLFFCFLEMPWLRCSGAKQLPFFLKSDNVS